MVREPYLTIDTKRKESIIIHCLIIIQGFIMKNSKGFPTIGLYGFINMINKIIEE